MPSETQPPAEDLGDDGSAVERAPLPSPENSETNQEAERGKAAKEAATASTDNTPDHAGEQSLSMSVFHLTDELAQLRQSSILHNPVPSILSNPLRRTELIAEITHVVDRLGDGDLQNEVAALLGDVQGNPANVIENIQQALTRGVLRNPTARSEWATVPVQRQEGTTGLDDVAALAQAAVLTARSTHDVPGGVPPVRVDRLTSVGPIGGASGGLMGSGRNQPGMILVNPDAPDAVPAFLRAYSHVIDHTLVDSPFSLGSYEGVESPDTPMGRWWQAVEGSAAVRYLQAEAANESRPPHEHRMIAAMLSPIALFGRTYTQFVLREAGDPALLRQFVRHRAAYDYRVGLDGNSHWSDKDFQPIADALREALPPPDPTARGRTTR